MTDTDQKDEKKVPYKKKPDSTYKARKRESRARTAQLTFPDVIIDVVLSDEP